MVSEIIKELREQNNLSQEALAKKLEVTQQVIARWESGQCEPNSSSLRKFYEIFGITPNEILGIDEIKSLKMK